MTIRAFIANGNTYTFPTSTGDQSFKAPFASIPAKITRLPGTDGGFDEYGMGRGAADTATVEVNIVLESATVAGMQALRDSLRTIAAWGKGRLIDTINGVDRWCWARITLPDIAENRHLHTDIFQPVKLTFSVSDPYWYTVGTEALWGGGWKWGDGTKWGGTAVAQSISTSGSFTITNNGNADTLARIVVKNTSGSTISYPRIRRIVNGAIRDELYYNSTIATGTQLTMNARGHRASIMGVNVLNNLTYMHPDWMRLLPGANAFTVSLIGAATVYVAYYERFV